MAIQKIFCLLSSVPQDYKEAKRTLGPGRTKWKQQAMW